MRLSRVVVAGMLAVATTTIARQLTEKPSFEVASIKPYAESTGPVFNGFRVVPGSPRMEFSGVTVKMLLTWAYRIKDFQIIGGPDWINSERYDIQVKAEDGSVTRKDFADPTVFPEPFAVRIQSLLDERLHLKMHRETRDLQVYELLIAGGGSRMTLSSDQSPQEPVTFGDPLPGPGSMPIRRVGVAIRRTVGGFTLEGRSVTMASFVDVLSQHVGRPIVNKANLRPGLYDITLQWSGTLSPGATPETTDGLSIFTALQQQLGLRLASSKGAAEVLIIDSVQRPTPN